MGAAYCIEIAIAELDNRVVKVKASKNIAIKKPVLYTVFIGSIRSLNTNGRKKIPPVRLRIKLIQTGLAFTDLMIKPVRLHKTTAINTRKLPLFLNFNVSSLDQRTADHNPVQPIPVRKYSMTALRITNITVMGKHHLNHCL